MIREQLTTIIKQQYAAQVRAHQRDNDNAVGRGAGGCQGANNRAVCQPRCKVAYVMADWSKRPACRLPR